MKDAQAPVFADIPLGTRAVDPVVQALTLTDVVVGTTVTALLLAIARAGPQALRDARSARASRRAGARRMADLAPLAVAIPLLAAAVLVGASRRSSAASGRSTCWRSRPSVAVRGAVRAGARRRVGRHARPLVRRLDAARRHRARDLVRRSTRSVPAWRCSHRALFVAAFVFCWRYFVVIGPLFHALMLVFLAAMLGFSLTGDLFNLFVFFELLSVAAYALVAYDIEEEGPLTGSAQLRDHEQHRGVPDPGRDRAAVRAHRRAQHGADRRGAGRASRRTGSWSWRSR